MFWKRPPPPPPFYKKPSIVAIVVTVISLIVFGPVGVIYNSMSEELKQKVDNTTLQLMIQKDREAIERQEAELKEKEQKDKTQDKAIIENQKTLMMMRQKAVLLEAPKNVVITKKADDKKPVLTPEQFEKYLTMNPEIQVKYKAYLQSRGFDVSGLP